MSKKGILLLCLMTAAVLIGVGRVENASSDTLIPARGPDITFTADPTTIANGDSSRLTWSSPTADECKEPGGWFFNDPISGSKVVSPSSTTDYEVSCRNSSGTRTETVTVRVEKCPLGNTCHGDTIDVKVNGSDGPLTFNSLPITLNISVTVTDNDPWWAILSPDVDQCADWNGVKILYGPGTYNTPSTISNASENYKTHFYPVTCYFGTGGDSIRDSVDVIIENPSVPGPIPQPTINLTFTANPTSITKGQSSTLSWSTSNATTCGASASPSDSNWSGNITPVGGGSKSVSPSSTTTYNLSCSGDGGNIQKSEVVAVVNAFPTGYHDGVDNNTCETWGWARDADTPNTPVEVHVYVDAPAGGANLPIYAATADQPRTEPSWPFPDKNHGFRFTLPAGLKDGKQHQLYIYPIDTTTKLGSPSNILNNSPKTIQCGYIPTTSPIVNPGVPFVDIRGK